jgi:hypothetical protein
MPFLHMGDSLSIDHHFLQEQDISKRGSHDAQVNGTAKHGPSA